jgi:DNA-binding transcriptional ArsR family regulator|tara:strand:- start:369 stop:653 length:285 start_codon:yes stop_codon:yes gene_type:complete
MFKKLNPILHSELRLAIISLLIANTECEFNFLLEKSQSSKGNLSVQLKKLKEVKYILVEKSFRDNYPLTTCKITKKGRLAFEEYVDDLKSFINI